MKKEKVGDKKNIGLEVGVKTGYNVNVYCHVYLCI